MFKFPKKRRRALKKKVAPVGVSNSPSPSEEAARQAFAERIGKALITADARRRKARGERFH
jgi:hypothetical protein